MLKIDSIVKKWKPASKIDKKFVSTDSNFRARKKYSHKEVNKLAELPLETPRSEAVNRMTSSPDKRDTWKA